MAKHKRDVSIVFTGGDGGVRVCATSVLRVVAATLAACFAVAAVPAGASAPVRASLAPPSVASERAIVADAAQPRVAQVSASESTCSGSERTPMSSGESADDLIALIVAGVRPSEGESHASATSCGHNLQCYPSLRACEAECCGVCERRINCGGATGHKCFE